MKPLTDEERKRQLDLHRKEREVGFANEAFAITVLQAVSTAAHPRMLKALGCG